MSLPSVFGSGFRPAVAAVPWCVSAAALGGSSAAAGAIDLPGWDLVFNDEFDQASPDTSAWELLNRKDSFNNEKQYYLADQVSIDGGNLVLTATDVPLAGKDYRSGLVRTHQEWSYGRFEARIDLPTTQGMWPAFWLLPRTVDWPSGGEIDIMENRGSQPGLVSSAYHWGPDFFGRQFIFDEYTSADAGGPVNFHNSFHEYAVEWEPGVLRFFVDGNNYHTITGAQAEIFDTPKSIILNLAVGGDFGGDPNGSTVFPQEMLIDYVRVWQRPENPDPGNNLLTNPSFENNGGSLSGWTTFGNTIPNVLAEDGFPRDGSHALKMFGQFNGDPFAGVTQGVAVTEGAALTATASAFTPSFDTLFGKSNEVLMKIEFYSAFGAALGSADFLGEVSEVILDGTSNENFWHDALLEAVAPAGAVEARLAFVFHQPGNDDGAAWIDAVSLVAAALLAGDYNGNGLVEQGDLDLVLGNWGVDTSGAGNVPVGWVNDAPDGLIEQAELDAVLGNWGSAASPDFRGVDVPEPAGAAALLALAGSRRRRAVVPRT